MSQSHSAFAQCVRVLPKVDQQKIFVVILIQTLLGVFDLLGVIAIGLLGSLTVSGLQVHTPGTRVTLILRFLHISNASLQKQTLILGVIAISFLIGRTLMSIFFTRRILFFLSRRGAAISASLVRRLLAQPLLSIQERTSQATLFSLTRGVEYITLQVIATAVILVADISLLLIIGVGLMIIDPITAIGTFLVFSLVGFFLFKLMHTRAETLGYESSTLNILSNEKIIEVFSSYRESIVRNRRDYYAREIGKLRFQLADVAAELNFMPYISKYVIETTVILGSVLLGVTQFITHDATHAVATLAIFLAAGSRIAPSVLRAQQGLVQIKGSLAMSEPTLELIASLGESTQTENQSDLIISDHTDFQATIEVQDLTFSYPGQSTPILNGISLSIPAGKFVAIVGPSGAGKTTLIDALLGVLPSTLGNVQISGVEPSLAIAKWPGAISYVPQDVMISNGTVRENIGLGFPTNALTDEIVMRTIRLAHLEDFISGLSDGLNTMVGERGAKISGGQRQRLGIARSMLTSPRLLFLDEATSSVDGETESNISQSIQSLRGNTTVVMVAHRLSTVRSADIVMYLDKGRIVSAGTFEEVRSAVPEFEIQAKLMGL